MPRRRIGCCATLVLLALVALLGMGDAGARVRTTITVNPTPGAGNFTTIQAAVNAAAPSGDTIRVDPGTYTEQVTINKSVTVVGASGAVIKAPTTMTPDGDGLRAIVEVNTAATVNLSGFTLEGPSSAINVGALVVRGATLNLSDNTITEINQGPATFGVQTGVAVQAGSKAPPDVGHVTATGNTLEHYQKAGFLVGGTGSTGDILDNTVIGTPTTEIAQNGIEVSPGAAVKEIVENIVDDNRYTGAGGESASGILLSGSVGPVSVAGNTLHDNQVGIDLKSASGADILANESVGAVDGGIVADKDSSGNTLVRNSAVGAEDPNVDCLDDSRGGGSAGTANAWRGNIGASSLPKDLCSPGPITTIDLHPPAPNGPGGAYSGSVRVTVSASRDGGSEVTGTRCVLDPPSPPARFRDLPAGRCPYLGPGADVSAPGHHTVYASSVNAAKVTDAAIRSTSFTITRPPPPPRTLSIARAGSGAGTVISTDGNIDCGSTCSHTYPSGTQVTLDARPDSGSTFAGWSGACSGTGTCAVTMSSDQSVTATFTVSTPPPPTGCQDAAGAYNQGFDAGFDAGFDSGFNSGFNDGFNPGFNAGFHAGFRASRDLSLARYQAVARQALTAACDQLFNEGFSSGFDSGFNAGFNRGFDVGFGAGFNDGFDAGFRARHNR